MNSLLGVVNIKIFTRRHPFTEFKGRSPTPTSSYIEGTAKCILHNGFAKQGGEERLTGKHESELHLSFCFLHLNLNDKLKDHLHETTTSVIFTYVTPKKLIDTSNQ